jgi:hypothetical protein
MPGVALKRQWRPVFVVGGMSTIVVLAGMLAVTWPAVGAWRAGAPIAGGVSLEFVLVTDAALVVAIVWLNWHLAAMTLTVGVLR